MYNEGQSNLEALRMSPMMFIRTSVGLVRKGCFYCQFSLAKPENPPN